MNNTPYIHLFRTSENCYLYDVNTDKILMLPENVYNKLDGCMANKNGSFEADPFIEKLKKAGYLKCKRVREARHYATHYLKYYLDNNLSHLILQVTL